MRQDSPPGKVKADDSGEGKRRTNVEHRERSRCIRIRPRSFLSLGVFIRQGAVIWTGVETSLETSSSRQCRLEAGFQSRTLPCTFTVFP